MAESDLAPFSSPGGMRESCEIRMKPPSLALPRRERKSQREPRYLYDPETAQHRHHRPRRPRQDHARRQAPPAVRHLRRPPADGHAHHGLERPGEGARDHHSRQEHRTPLEGLPHQHRRHAGPRRLRRRSRARAGDGRLGAAAGGRDGRPDAADALRHAQGLLSRPAPDCGHQQG